jgi:hypothetical protein
MYTSILLYENNEPLYLYNNITVVEVIETAFVEEVDASVVLDTGPEVDSGLLSVTDPL